MLAEIAPEALQSGAAVAVVLAFIEGAKFAKARHENGKVERGDTACKVGGFCEKHGVLETTMANVTKGQDKLAKGQEKIWEKVGGMDKKLERLLTIEEMRQGN